MIIWVRWKKEVTRAGRGEQWQAGLMEPTLGKLEEAIRQEDLVSLSFLEEEITDPR